MLKDAIGNTLKKGDWYLDLGSQEDNILGCIYSITRWKIKTFTIDPWNSVYESEMNKIYSEHLIKIESLKSNYLIKQYLNICRYKYFKLFISNSKKTYKPLTLIDSPLCGS